MLNFTLHASIGEMKKIVSIWTLFFTYSFLGFAQNPITYANDYATMPVAVVKVNFHFLPVNPTYAGSNINFTQLEAQRNLPQRLSITPIKIS
jgi:hypothetical protein